MTLIKANVRDPIVAEGDLYSLTACNDAGARALLEMLEDFGLVRFGSGGCRNTSALKNCNANGDCRVAATRLQATK